MPRTLKSSKFFLYSAKKSGHQKGKMLLGVNHNHKGGTDNINLQDLIDFLGAHNIDPSKVELLPMFMTTVKV